jgi:Zn-dependent M16 (insulinase) family peptidase
MQVHNFKFEESHYIDEICSTFLKYVHPSGLQVIKINNLDPQNVACIHFHTIPENSNGSPHILEHVVLCGSKKYDVKDPFFSMLRRSIAGYANALTGSDFTIYPFAAHVKEDFFNLLEVYLDAVFHPLIDKASFLQEGSRVTEEGYKGVVFNEMKQAHSSLDDRFHHETLSQLFPDTSYRFDSGGTPKEIVTSTHEELVAFHKENYHPSNALIFLYGNLDIDAQLAAIENSIKDIPGNPKHTKQKVLQPRFKKKKEHHTFYPGMEEDKTKHLTIGYILGDQRDQDHLLDALFLKSYLAGHDGSPLQRAIMGENLASSVDVMLDLEVLEPYIYFIFKDVLDGQKLIASFDKTLEKISLEGFDAEAKNSTLNQLKIAFLNTVEEGFPTGVILFFKGVLPFFNGADPLELFCFKKRLQKLEKRIADPLYLKKAIQRIFLSNSHRTEVHFTNKPHLLEEELPAPLAIDAEIKKRIAQESHLVELKQSKPRNFACLPILHIEQLPPQPPTYPLEKKGGEIPIFVHNSWTNGVSYFHLMIDLPDLNENDSHYLGLLANLLGSIGTKKRNFNQLIEKKESIFSQFLCRIDATEKNIILNLEAQSLSENLKEGFLLVQEILEETVFIEKERLQEIMKDLLNRIKAMFTQRSYGNCILYGKSHLRTALKVVENACGFSFYNWLKKEITKPIDEIIGGLETLYQRLLKGDGLNEISLCTDLKEIPPFSLQAPKTQATFKNHVIETSNQSNFSGYCAPIQVSENAFVFNGFRFDDPETPIARVVVQLIKHLQLHPILREKHGAYGASISIDPEQGLFTMFTSCDPNIDLTYQIFREVFNPIIAGEFSDEDLYEAKLAALQVTEEISLLNMRAQDQYWRNRYGRTETKRLDDRNRLIKADRSAIRECTAKILGKLTGGISVTLSAKKAFEKLKHHPSTLVEL